MNLTLKDLAVLSFAVDELVDRNISSMNTAQYAHLKNLSEKLREAEREAYERERKTA